MILHERLKCGWLFVGGLYLLVATGAVQAGPFSWFKSLMPQQPSPADPHLYPEGSLLYDIWTCKGETEQGWIGVTNEFTDRDPYVVVVVRSEFPEQAQLRLHLGVEVIGPRHNMIIAADRVVLERNQDIAFFYHPRDLGRIGGWGEYRIVLSVDGSTRDQIEFRLEEKETLDKAREDERLRAEAEQALASGDGGGSSQDLEARSLLGAPDAAPEGSEDVGHTLGDVEPTVPEIVVQDPTRWYEHSYGDAEGKIIMFPKKARRTWQENVHNDLKHRIQYYIFL